MRGLVMSALLAVMLLACGGSKSETLDPGFGGEWSGAATYTAAGYAPYSANVAIIVATSDQSLSVGPMCPDGTGSLSMSGGGESAARFAG